VSGRLAGVFAAFLLAFSVIHLRESHFFSLDVSMTFFTVVAWCFLVRTVERGDAVGRRRLRARPRDSASRRSIPRRSSGR
jgi:4-amino-4-deoxy-L-arabinose transferase-like glycosyltransferase